MSPKNLPPIFQESSAESFSAPDAQELFDDSTAKTSTLHPSNYALEHHMPWLMAFDVNVNESMSCIDRFLEDQNPKNFYEEIDVETNFMFCTGSFLTVKATPQSMKKCMQSLYDASIQNLNDRLTFFAFKNYNDFLAVWDLSIYDKDLYLMAITTNDASQSYYKELLKKVEQNSHIHIQSTVEIKPSECKLEVLKKVEKNNYATQLLVHNEKNLLNRHIDLPQLSNLQNKKTMKI